MAKRDYYEVLGVPKTASPDELKKAFRRAAIEHHPDKGGDEAKFKEVNEAYEVLGNAEKRQRYDQFGHAGVGGAAGGGGNPFGNGQSINFDFGDMGGFGDLFNSFFGGGFGQQRQKRGRDLQTIIELTFNEAVFGTEKEIKLSHATGSKENTLKLKIPAGVDDGNTIRVRERGEHIPDGPAGDLFVQIRVRPHKHFTREGSLILSAVHVSMADAALGTEIDVDTVDGQVRMKVPAGTQSGTDFKLSGHGVPMSPERRGSHIVTVIVDTPTKLSKRQQELLEEFRQSGKKGFWN
jgi:molecular chaperone DnaJ